MTDLPSGWITASLADICEVNPRVDKSGFEPRTIVSFVPMSAIEAETGKINISEECAFSQVRQGYTPFVKSDILFAKITPCMENGKVAIVPDLLGDTGFGSTEFHVLRPRTGIEPRFVYHVVSSKTFRYHAEHNMTGAVGQKRVPSAVLEEHETGIPPQYEQRRIVEKIESMFDEIDNGCGELRTAKASLDLYRQSLLKSAFEGRLTADWRVRNSDSLEDQESMVARMGAERDGWYQRAKDEWKERVELWKVKGESGPKPRSPEKYNPSEEFTAVELSAMPDIPLSWIFIRLKDVAAINSGMSVSKARNFIDPVEVPYLRVANVQRGFLDLGDLKEMQVEQSQLASLCLAEWDILFNEGGDRDKLGRGWIWECQVSECITQNHVFRASPFKHDKKWSEYISRWGNSFGRDYFEKCGKQTTNLASINKAVLMALPVPCCSSEEQAEIMRLLDTHLETANALEAEIDAALLRADALRQSILKKAFSGQLVPQDPSDEPASVLLERIRAERAAAPKPTRKRKASA